MEKTNECTYRIETQGLGCDMTFNTVASCGNIKDGVGFGIGKGGWVISYEDFIAMFEAARQQRPETAEDAE